MYVRSSAALLIALIAGPALAQGPLPDPIVKGSTRAVLRDVVQVPPSAVGAPLARLKGRTRWHLWLRSLNRIHA